MSNQGTVGLGVVAVAMALTTSALAQNVDWRLHNLDLAGSRYSEMDQIDRSNVQTLTPRWLFQHGVIDGVSNQTTPVVVDGSMYLTDSRGSVYALNAADGHLLWTYDVTELLGARATSSGTAGSPTSMASSTAPPARSSSRSTRRPVSRSRDLASTDRRARF